MNLYGFVNNTPTNAIDRYGLSVSDYIPSWKEWQKYEAMYIKCFINCLKSLMCAADNAMTAAISAVIDGLLFSLGNTNNARSAVQQALAARNAALVASGGNWLNPAVIALNLRLTAARAALATARAASLAKFGAGVGWALGVGAGGSVSWCIGECYHSGE